MSTQLNDVSIFVNNEQVAYTADSLSWKDGLGEYKIRNAIVGGGQVEQVFSQDLATKMGMIKFSMPTTVDNEGNKRTWKLNKNANVVEIIGNGGEEFTKIFTSAAILDDPESSAATDGNIEIEFNSLPAQ